MGKNIKLETKLTAEILLFQKLIEFYIIKDEKKSSSIFMKTKGNQSHVAFNGEMKLNLADFN